MVIFINIARWISKHDIVKIAVEFTCVVGGLPRRARSVKGLRMHAAWWNHVCRIDQHGMEVARHDSAAVLLSSSDKTAL